MRLLSNLYKQRFITNESESRVINSNTLAYRILEEQSRALAKTREPEQPQAESGGFVEGIAAPQVETIDYEAEAKEKAEEILKYIKTIEQKSIWGLYCYPKYECTLYKTQKGNFFVHVGKYVGNTDVSYQDKDKIELLSEKEVKEILNQLNEVETYKKIFNDLEEG